MASREKSTKTEKFDIRLSQQEEAVIKQAAMLQRTSPTNFIRQQALLAAEAVVHEQSRVLVSEEQWRLIEDAMSEPAKVLPNLRAKIIQHSDDWDK